MEEILKLKTGNTRERWNRAVENAALDPIRQLALLKTPPPPFLGRS